MLSIWRRRFAEPRGIAADRTTVEAALADFGGDSLDLVEFVMELEDAGNVSVPDDVYERIRSVGDAIRYIAELRRDRER
ncbi:MAG: acyl carrier protein [Planctomycetaceae bacterium]|nr:acyl carrier protein [Planctomycetaceae bacterium]